MKFGFFAFAPGLPGMALVLLRISVAVSLVEVGVGNDEPLWMIGLAGGVALALGLGVWTRANAVGAAIIYGWLWLSLGAHMLSAHFATVLDAMALILIGPGAFSIDAKRFGRRTVHVAE